jgi:hypothetical protein
MTSTLDAQKQKLFFEQQHIARRENSSVHAFAANLVERVVVGPALLVDAEGGNLALVGQPKAQPIEERHVLLIRQFDHLGVARAKFTPDDLLILPERRIFRATNQQTDVEGTSGTVFDGFAVLHGGLLELFLGRFLGVLSIEPVCGSRRNQSQWSCQSPCGAPPHGSALICGIGTKNRAHLCARTCAPKRRQSHASVREHVRVDEIAFIASNAAHFRHHRLGVMIAFHQQT